MKRWVPWAGVAVCTLAVVGGFALDAASDNSLYLPPIAIPFVAVGALLALRRPENPIGWLFLGFGMVASVDYLAEQYSAVALSAGSDLPAKDLVTAFAAQVQAVLGDRRSWIGNGRVRLQRVGPADAHDFRIFLATRETAGRLCAAGGGRRTPYRRTPFRTGRRRARAGSAC